MGRALVSFAIAVMRSHAQSNLGIQLTLPGNSALLRKAGWEVGQGRSLEVETDAEAQCLSPQWGAWKYGGRHGTGETGEYSLP